MQWFGDFSFITHTQHQVVSQACTDAILDKLNGHIAIVVDSHYIASNLSYRVRDMQLLQHQAALCILKDKLETEGFNRFWQTHAHRLGVSARPVVAPQPFVASTSPETDVAAKLQDMTINAPFGNVNIPVPPQDDAHTSSRDPCTSAATT